MLTLNSCVLMEILMLQRQSLLTVMSVHAHQSFLQAKVHHQHILSPKSHLGQVGIEPDVCSRHTPQMGLQRMAGCPQSSGRGKK